MGVDMGNEASDQEVDMSQPGSETRGMDGVATQLTEGDTLTGQDLADPLDEGYSPPDREPSVHVPTPAEESAGESLDDRLAEEVPEAGSDDPDDEWELEVSEVGGRRSGRLVDENGGTYQDTEADMVATDVGIDGAGASAEEAAMHILDPLEEYGPQSRPHAANEAEPTGGRS